MKHVVCLFEGTSSVVCHHMPVSPALISLPLLGYPGETVRPVLHCNSQGCPEMCQDGYEYSVLSSISCTISLNDFSERFLWNFVITQNIFYYWYKIAPSCNFNSSHSFCEVSIFHECTNLWLNKNVCLSFFHTEFRKFKTFAMFIYISTNCFMSPSLIWSGGRMIFFLLSNGSFTMLAVPVFKFSLNGHVSFIQWFCFSRLSHTACNKEKDMATTRQHSR